MVFKFFLLTATLHGIIFWSIGKGQVCNTLGFICTTCDSLQLCTSGVPGSIVLTCPTGTFCDSNSASLCTATPCTAEPIPYYNCTTTGRFPVADTNCSQYVFCANSTTLGILVPQLFECPTTTVFNPDTARCVLPTAYTCPDSVVTTTVPTTDSTCTRAGRFPDTTDSTCQSYYFCLLLANGTYSSTPFTCPTTTVFNENTQTCVLPTAYTCPY